MNKFLTSVLLTVFIAPLFIFCITGCDFLTVPRNNKNDIWGDEYSRSFAAEISSTLPYNEQTGVAPDTNIIITFNDEVDPGSSWTVVTDYETYNNQSPEAVWSEDYIVLTITPADSFPVGVDVTVVASGFEVKYDGFPFADASVTFTIESAVLTVTIQPYNEQTNVLPDENILLTFNEEADIDSSWSVVVDDVTYDSLSSLISWNTGNTELTIDPDELFINGTDVIVTASGFTSEADSSPFPESAVTFSISEIAISIISPPDTITERDMAVVSIGLTGDLMTPLDVIVSSNNSAITVDATDSSILTFTPENMASNQTITLEAIDDLNFADEVVMITVDSIVTDPQTFDVTAVDDQYAVVLETVPGRNETNVDPTTGVIKFIFETSMDEFAPFNDLTARVDSGVFNSISTAGSICEWVTTYQTFDTLQITLSWIRFPENVKLLFYLNDDHLEYSYSTTFTTTIDSTVYPIFDTGQSSCYWADATDDWREDTGCTGTSYSSIGDDASPDGQDAHYTGASEQSYIPDEPVAGEQIVIDNNTGLTWRKCHLGRYGSICVNGSVTAVDWYTAVNDCSVLNSGDGFANITTWRLPNFQELNTLIGYGSEYIDETYFPNNRGRYPTSTVHTNPLRVYECTRWNTMSSTDYYVLCVSSP